MFFKNIFTFFHSFSFCCIVMILHGYIYFANRVHSSGTLALYECVEDPVTMIMFVIIELYIN